MSHAKPENYSWMSPYLCVADVTKAVAFYQKAFGFEKVDVAMHEGIAMHAEMRYQNQTLMMGAEGGCGYEGKVKTPKNSGIESPINMYVYCESVDDFHQHAVKQGAISLQAPEDMFWGDRMCRLQDPDGYVWSFATFSGQRQ